jgi:transposase
MKQTKLRTNLIKKTQHISFPIGTILAVQEYYEKLGFLDVFGKYKKKGHDLNSLIQALLSYKLTENLSISKASIWINRDEVLKHFKLKAFEERTLFRVLEIIGKNREEIMSAIQDRLFEVYDFEHTNINLDWTSLVLYGTKAKIAKYGFSKDHRPDKKQITIGVSELASPINVPIGLTVKDGNVNDMKHFEDTYKQVRNNLRKNSLVTFDKGANSKENTGLIIADKMKYLTAKKLNKSDDKRIKEFDKKKAKLIDSENKIYGVKFEKPNSIDYFYFSEKLEKEHLEAKQRKALRKFEEAKELQQAIDKGKPLPKKYRINNELVDITITYQTKLNELSEKEAKKLIKSAQITGREGFFCLKSSENLTLSEALETYRKKDSIEKIFHSLKNEIEIKPIRVWSDNSIYGALIIGFIAQLFISLIRYDHDELKHTSTKFIKKSLMNLTVTVEIQSTSPKRRIYSNFDPVNELILLQKQAVT